MNNELAKRLISLRKERGLSQEALAAALHVSRQAISKWERGEASPDTDNLIALAVLYRVSLDELVGFSLPEYEESEAVSALTPEEPFDEPAEVPAPEISDSDEIDTPIEDKPSETGFCIENEEYIVRICNGGLKVEPKPRKKRSVLSLISSAFRKKNSNGGKQLE